MSDGNAKLCPSKSTMYVSNLPFSLTTSDIHKMFEKFGKIVKVTILKNKDRESRGVAFINFLLEDDAKKCCTEMDGKKVFGRTLKSSIAKDNGRHTEFIRKRTYENKTRCYECGDLGHLSYRCPANVLGERATPERKPKTFTKRARTAKDEDDQKDDGDASPEPDYEVEERVIDYHDQSKFLKSKPKYKTSSYFSDEEELDD